MVSVLTDTVGILVETEGRFHVLGDQQFPDLVLSLFDLVGVVPGQSFIGMPLEPFPQESKGHALIAEFGNELGGCHWVTPPDIRQRFAVTTVTTVTMISPVYLSPSLLSLFSHASS